MPAQSLEKSFFFLQARRRSTCSKATPIEAINFARSYKLCLKPTDENPAPAKK
jgi:hypothetical protein